LDAQALTQESMGYFIEGNPQYPQIFIIDDLLEVVLVAAIGEVVAWMVERCLNHEFSESKLRRLVRWGCKKGVEKPEAGQLGLSVESLDAQYGDRMAFAITKTHDRVRPGLICTGHPMPEGA